MNSTAETPCEGGFFCPKSVSCDPPQPCKCGYRCPKGAISMQMCVSPFYCPNETAVVQSVCPIGYYCPDNGMCKALPCPNGTYVGESDGKASCPLCQAGRYCPSPLTSILCPAGNYCPNGSSSYKICPAGSYCFVGFATPLPCKGGHYCPQGTSVGLVCPAGSYCINGSSVSAICPAGSYCLKGSSHPTPCPAGTSHSGSTSKKDCVETKRRSLMSVEEGGSGILSTVETGFAQASREKPTVTLVNTAIYVTGSFVALIAVSFLARFVSSKKLSPELVPNN